MERAGEVSNSQKGSTQEEHTGEGERVEVTPNEVIKIAMEQAKKIGCKTSTLLLAHHTIQNMIIIDLLRGATNETKENKEVEEPTKFKKNFDEYTNDDFDD